MKKIITITLLMLCSIAFSQTKKTTPITVGIGKYKIGAVLKDTAITNYETSHADRTMKEVRTYLIAEYKPNEFVTLTNFDVMTFRGVIVSFKFDFDGQAQKMLEAKYKVDFETDEMQSFVSPIKTIRIFGTYEDDKVYIIDEAGFDRIKKLKYKGI